MAIEVWRKQIDEIDREILDLLNHRAELALRVGAWKKAAGRPLCDPGRERDVLRHAVRHNGGPLEDRAVTQLFRQIIRESRRVEERALRPGVPAEVAR